MAGALVVDALTDPGPARSARVGTATCARVLMAGVSPQDAIAGYAILYGAAAQAFADHPGVAAEPPLARYARAGP